VELGAVNFLGDFDIIRFVRRKRMHGFGLNFLLNHIVRNNSARLAFSRPLLEKDDLQPGIYDPTDIN